MLSTHLHSARVRKFIDRRSGADAGGGANPTGKVCPATRFSAGLLDDSSSLHITSFLSSPEFSYLQCFSQSSSLQIWQHVTRETGSLPSLHYRIQKPRENSQ